MNIDKSSNSPLTTKEKNTPDIEPETRTENKENASQPIGQPAKDYRAPGTEALGLESYKSHHFEQPNTELIIVKTIQGLINVIEHNLSKLPDSPLKQMAQDNINIYETGCIFELQKVFE